MSITQGAIEATSNGVSNKGRLIPLRTRDELRAALETIDVYAVAVPARFAGTILNVIRDAIPELKTVNIQHLRRVVQPEFLPIHLQNRFHCLYDLWNVPSSPNDASYRIGQEIEVGMQLRHLLIAPISLIPLRRLIEILSHTSPFVDFQITPQFAKLPVPALAPTSAEQAKQWSQAYWPIFYKNTNPYGPHPSLVARNAEQLESGAATWLALARTAGEQLSDLCLGENVGCAVVDQTGTTEHVIGVAGDARWCSSGGEPFPEREGPGNVMAHAVLRAIAMVANKRLRNAATEAPLHTTLGYTKSSSSCSFRDKPLVPIEERFYASHNVSPNGYLCVDLDIYITHEPCIMCSMAILHSRFRRCIIGRRVPLTGGITAEPETGLGCGIFWRPSELNWKFLAWEWQSEDVENLSSVVQDTLHM